MANKYVKVNGVVSATSTDNLKLEKPLTNEFYDINVHNRNMDKIDNAIKEVKGKVDGIELQADKVSIADVANRFIAENVEDALLETCKKIDGVKLELDKDILANETSILGLQNEVLGSKKALIKATSKLNKLL